MLKVRLILVLLFVACFSLAAYLQPRHAAREQMEGRSGSALALMLGDGRKLFANEIFAKADAYFHRGNYPSIFDLNARKEEHHMTGETSHDRQDEPGPADEHHDDEKEEPPPARDWIERFGRHFYPSEHVHLAEGEAYEMLPWLRLSAELDPHQIETYTVAAYWLRERLGKVDEAEQFLRDGLRENPNDPELLNELARLFFKNRADSTRARNLWLVALRRWQEVEAGKEKPNEFLLEQILSGLMQIAVQRNELADALTYLTRLKTVSPNPDAIQRKIDDVQEQLSKGSPAPPH